MVDARIRAARVEDAGRIAEMADALNRFEGKPPCPLQADDVVRLGFGDRPLFSVLIAECAGRAEGYALFYPGYDVESASSGAHLVDLYVETAFRGQGVGRALIEAVARASKQRGASWVAWHVMEKNAPGIAFYEAVGAKREPLLAYHFDRKALAALD